MNFGFLAAKKKKNMNLAKHLFSLCGIKPKYKAGKLKNSAEVPNYQTKPENLEQSSLWQLNSTKGITLSRNKRLDQKEEDFGLSAEESLLHTRLKKELPSTRKKSVWKQNLDFIGSNMDITTQASFTK